MSSTKQPLPDDSNEAPPPAYSEINLGPSTTQLGHPEQPFGAAYPTQAAPVQSPFGQTAVVTVAPGHGGHHHQNVMIVNARSEFKTLAETIACL